MTDMAALRRSRLDMNDLGNAWRLFDVAAGRLLYVEDMDKAWVAFDRQRWSVEYGSAFALSCAQSVAAGIEAEMMALRMAKIEELEAVYWPGFGDEARKARIAELEGWRIKTGNSDKSSGMLKQATGLTDAEGRFVMRARGDDFDADPMAYHVRNGTIRFFAGAQGWDFSFTAGHRADDRFMQMADVDYDKGANCPHWQARLTELHDDPVQRDAIQRIYGSTLTALISDQAFYVFQGGGNDGKSMTNEVIGALHGSYFRSSAPHVFLQAGTQKDASSHQSAVVRLAGDIRLVVCDEPPTRSTWDGNRIKQITGSKVTARGFHVKEEKTFTPHWKLIVECNDLPKMPSDDRGFRRRFKLYPWLKSYGVTAGLSADPPHVVLERLKGELSGILNWMIEGAIRWLNAAEIPEPAMSKLALSSFWDAQSPIGEWIEACCDISDKSARTSSRDLYESFRQFRIDAGDKEDRIASQTALGIAFNKMQIYAQKDASGRNQRIGIRLKDKADLAGGGAPAAGADDWGGTQDFDEGQPSGKPSGKLSVDDMP